MLLSLRRIAVLIATASSVVSAEPSPGPTRYTLRNGLRVVLEPDSDSARAAVFVRYGVGSRDDPPGFRGLAHLTEHMTFRAGQHLARLEALGATEFNGITTLDETYYFAVLPPQAIESALWLEARRMAFAAEDMQKRDLALERQIVVHEWRQRSHAAAELLDFVSARIYPTGHPYRAQLDRPEDIGLMRLAHVQWFTQSHYRPENASLVVLGAFERTQVEAWVERYFGAVRASGTGVPRVPVPASRLEGVTRVRFDANAAHQLLAVTWPVPGREHPDFAALEVAARVLTESLTERLREDARTASLAAAVLLPAEHGSLFWMEVLAREQRLAENFLPELDRHVQRIREGSVAAASLARAQRSLRLSAVREADSPPTRALALARSIAVPGRGRSAALDVDRYDAVDAADLSRVLKAWLPRERRVVSIVTDEPGSGSPRVERDAEVSQ